MSAASAGTGTAARRTGRPPSDPDRAGRGAPQAASESRFTAGRRRGGGRIGQLEGSV